METRADRPDALPSALYVFVDREDNSVLAALQESSETEPFPMLTADEELLPRYVQVVRAYGAREGRCYRLFRFDSCVEVHMGAIAPPRGRPALRVVPGGLPRELPSTGRQAG